MSNEALLKNSLRVLKQPNGLKKVREDIENVEYHFGLIDENVFLNNLIWMGPPGPWRTYTPSATKEGKVYEKIAPKGESRSLQNVAERIRLKYSIGTPEHDTPEQLLYRLYQESDWFGRHLSFTTHFDTLLLSLLWVRSIRENEKGDCGESGWQDKLYIEDGNHRALVYALRILYGQEFLPVPILWCRSWKHILCWAGEPETAEQDSPPPKLKKYFERSTVGKYLSRFKNLSEF